MLTMHFLPQNNKFKHDNCHLNYHHHQHHKISLPEIAFECLECFGIGQRNKNCSSLDSDSEELLSKAAKFNTS